MSHGYTVYLAGLNIKDPSGLTGWKEEVESLVPEYFNCVSPYGKVEDEEGSSPLIGSLLRVSQWQISKCDAFLVNLLGAKKIDLWTVLEISLAKSLGKPIVVCRELGGNPYDQEILGEIAWFQTSVLREAVDWVLHLLQ